ncbi:Uncharacterised protein [Mycolicibacterium phlei]|uniref:hypothetical protein n=1 Tax=Mycobacteroides chelonae TaxID=1774 RepID=UPI000618AA12|nr:hypothetical protein [Mycobacteroides chelonae]VEG15100.1 Uncharacterised protein [Mycolicibacterium phlei]AKC37993.1 hypothetical protein GR01_04605 [Mycobacteroides chelonae]ANB00799.1 hypothetical protein BB28_04695 [Mycobacteroides chelonae CCUG 47445]OLT80802.1 hypothetical protein BKG56_00375 [Mycobacteroides chelonae]ORV16829.1 hypothetical protein AWB96_00660 [Mycobacteroides chelonae]
MHKVPVAYMRLDSRDGTAILAVQVAQPVKSLAVSIFAHDSVDVAWRASLELKSTDNPLVWRAAWEIDPGLPPLLEVGNINETGPTWGAIKIGHPRWIFLKPQRGDGEWVTGELALAELARIENLREQRFTAPLRATSTPQNASEFLILALADNLLITQPQRVPGISLSPVTTILGEDVRTVLNRILRSHGIVTQWLSRKKWLAQMQSNRPAVLIKCHVQAENPDAASTHGREVIKELLDMMTLERGAAANLIAGVIASRNEHGRYALHGAWIEHSGYGENLIGGVISGEDVHALQESWSGLQANSRAQLWVSLYADAVRDPRWEYRFFRCFNLLEAIADTVVQPNAVIADEAGNPRKFQSGKGNYTTKQAQGKVYMLLLQLAGKNADDQLWDEVGHWVRVRNDVAHDGTWQAPHAGEKPEHAATRTAIASHGHDGTFEMGTRPFVDKIRESVKQTLHAAIRGKL